MLRQPRHAQHRIFWRLDGVDWACPCCVKLGLRGGEAAFARGLERVFNFHETGATVVINHEVGHPLSQCVSAHDTGSDPAQRTYNFGLIPIYSFCHDHIRCPQPS